MIATKQWQCDCGCDEKIKPGDEFSIIEGTFYKKDHEEKLKRPVKNAKSK